MYIYAVKRDASGQNMKCDLFAYNLCIIFLEAVSSGNFSRCLHLTRSHSLYLFSALLKLGLSSSNFQVF